MPQLFDAGAVYHRYIRCEEAEKLTRWCRVCFGAAFYLNYSVPPNDYEPLPNGNGLSMLNGAVSFATTHWSMIVTAQGESPAADEALEKLCRIYWWPVYSFIRRQGAGPEDAKDLTQSFFAVLFERRDLQAVRRENGRLRSFFLASLKNFLAKVHRHATTAKRGEGRPVLPLDELLTGKRGDREPADRLSADRIFERRWALTVLEQALARLEDEYRTAGNAQLFEKLKQVLTDEPNRPSQVEIADEFGMTQNAINQAFHRMRQRYRKLLHEEIRHTVIAPDDTEDELRHLIAALRG
jgi:RNA polymerase sigma factor (sigma-70 family)